jgi:phage-related protein
MSNWKVIVPEVATNKVMNPVQGATGNYTAEGGGTVTQVSTYSYLGYKCLRLVGAADNQGVSFTLSALANAIHYMTLRINTASDVTAFDVSLDDANYTEPSVVSQEGNWYVYSYQFPAAQANGSTKLYIREKGAGTIDLYIGHAQVEQNTYATTPITGDIRGFMTGGYTWNGAPHASTSTRSAQERSGGVVKDLETDYALRVRYGVGIGMPPITHHTQGMALLPGALYQGHKIEPRALDLVSATMITTTIGAHKARSNFINVFKPDRVSPEQPTVFRYYGANSTKPVDFYGYYDSGMGFDGAQGKIDQPTARFICYDPYAYEVGEGSAVLITTQSIANADEVVRRVNGTWSNISTDFNAAVFNFTKGLDGGIYIGGGFTNVGDANGDYIVKWNPNTSTLSSLGAGTGNIVNGLITAANGDIYVTGIFQNLTDANGDYITKWNGAAFSSLSTGLTGSGNPLCFGLDGTLYVGGDFTNLTDANGDYITKWNGTAFSSLSTGMTGIVYDLATHPSGDIFATGSFPIAGGVTVNGIARWNGTAWTACGAGLAGGAAQGTAVVIDKAGNVYVGGTFNTADGVTVNNIAKWNGKTFEPLGVGLNGGVYALALDDNGLLYASGVFTTAGGIDVADRLAVWNGTSWAHLDIDLPGNPAVTALFCSGKDLYIGYDTTGTAVSSYNNSVTNNGSTTAYPIIAIKRADDGTTATVEYLKNETTGATLWFDYALLKGETLTIDCTPGNRQITSDFFGPVWRAMLRNSDFDNFNLLPGINNIVAYVATSGAPTITAYMAWKQAHISADTVAA